MGHSWYATDRRSNIKPHKECNFTLGPRTWEGQQPEKGLHPGTKVKETIRSENRRQRAANKRRTCPACFGCEKFCERKRPPTSQPYQPDLSPKQWVAGLLQCFLHASAQPGKAQQCWGWPWIFILRQRCPSISQNQWLDIITSTML